MIDFMAQEPVSLEASATITGTSWYPAASGSGEGGAVFGRNKGEPELGRPFGGGSSLGESVLRKLWSLMRLEPGWDSYDARSISPDAVRTAIAFLVQSASRARPSIVPTSKGGIQLEWHDGLVDVEIECMPSGHAQLVGEDAESGETVERWVAPGHIAVEDWLAKLQPQR